MQEYKAISKALKIEVTALKGLLTISHKKKYAPEFVQERLYYLLRIINRIADQLELANPEFDRQQFLLDCGIE